MIEDMEIEDVEDLKVLPGVRALLEGLPPERWAIVTSATRRLLLGRLKHAGLPVPERIISADDAETGQARSGALCAGRGVAGVCVEGLCGGGGCSGGRRGWDCGWLPGAGECWGRMRRRSYRLRIGLRSRWKG